MNWITKILKVGEKIKTAIKKRPSKEETENSDWTTCCKGQVLKKELDNATEEIKQRSLKKDYLEKGIKDNNNILDDDLTIIGIGK